MKLTRRLLTYFVTIVFVILWMYSSEIRFRATSWLRDQVKEQLESTVAILESQIEDERGGLEWDMKRAIETLVASPTAYPRKWFVELDGEPHGDPIGQEIESANRNLGVGYSVYFDNPKDGSNWRILRKRRAATQSDQPSTDGERRYRTILIGAAVDLAPVKAIERKLGWWLLGATAFFMLQTVIGGTIFCYRALRPIREMATAAECIDASDFSKRLPVPSPEDELRQLGLAFNGALDRLSDAIDRERRFTSEASHQLRTPVTAILGQAQVALRNERTADEYRRALVAIEKQASTLGNLVETLLALARDPKEAVLWEDEAYSIGVFVAERLLPRFRENASDRQFRLYQRVADVKTRVRVTVLEHVVGNIVDNAILYSKPSDEIRIVIDADQSYALVRVIDSGPGIPETEKAQLFQPFFRGEAHQATTKGTGMGLSVSKRLIEAVNGRITIESSRSAGTTVEMAFPIATGVHGKT